MNRYASSKWKRKRNRRRLQISIAIFGIIVCAISIWAWNDYRKESETRDIGITYFQQKDYKNAEKAFVQALEYHNLFGWKLSQDIRYYLAESYFQEEQYEKALAVYEEIGKHEKLDDYVLCYQGACYAKLDQNDKAKNAFEEAIALGNDEGYHYLSKMYYDLGEYDKAISYEKKFMEVREANGSSYQILAKSYSKAGKFKEAIKTIEEGIALDDEQKQALLFEEIVIYEQKLDFDTAYEKCLEYVSAYPDDEQAKLELEFLETR